MATIINNVWAHTKTFDFVNCDASRLRDGLLLENLAAELPGIIGMEPHGPPVIELFGRPEGAEYGYTCIQLITTSHLAFHAAPNVRQFFLDITSCRSFRTQAVRRAVIRAVGGELEAMHHRKRGHTHY